MAEEQTTIKEEVKAPLSLKETVRETAAGLDADGKPLVVAEKKEEAKKEELKPDASAEAIRVSKAMELFEALENPEKRGAVIEFLATNSGYQKKPAETKAEIKEAKDDIKEALRESLGDEFSFLVDKLGPALDKIITKKVTESQADIRADLEKKEVEKLESQSAAALTKITDEFFGDKKELPKEVSDGMTKYMNRTPPDAKTPINEYIEDAFYAVVGKLGLVKVDKKTADKVKRNANDAPSRLASERATAIPGKPDTSSMTRKQAIQAAIDSIGDTIN